MQTSKAIEQGRSESQAWVRFSALAFYLESSASFLGKAEDLLAAEADQYQHNSLAFAISEGLEEVREAIRLLDKAPD
jgi:hypothetical protein